MECCFIFKVFVTRKFMQISTCILNIFIWLHVYFFKFIGINPWTAKCSWSHCMTEHLVACFDFIWQNTWLHLNTILFLVPVSLVACDFQNHHSDVLLKSWDFMWHADKTKMFFFFLRKFCFQWTWVMDE
jgi:hypothetical protein